MLGQCHLAKPSQGHTVTAGARGPCYLLVITSQPVALLNSCLETGFRSHWTLAVAVQVGPWCSQSRALRGATMAFSSLPSPAALPGRRGLARERCPGLKGRSGTCSPWDIVLPGEGPSLGMGSCAAKLAAPKGVCAKLVSRCCSGSAATHQGPMPRPFGWGWPPCPARGCVQAVCSVL